MTWLLLLLGALASDSQINVDRYNTLPEWTHTTLKRFELDANQGDLIRLLDRNVIYYKGDGKLYLHRQVIQVVQHPRAANSASQVSLAGDDDGSKLVGFNAWHLKPGGYSEELDKRDLVLYGGGAFGSLTSGTMSYSRFNHVGRGSVIAFETREEIQSFLGTVALFPIAGEAYTQKYLFELKDVSSNDVPVQFSIDPWGLEAWGLHARPDGSGLLIENIPAIPPEDHIYRDPVSHPAIFVNAYIKGENRYENWDAFAKWYYGVFEKIAYSEGPPSLSPIKAKRKELEALTSMVRDRVTYRQVYLSHARGWQPLPGKDVIHRAYGDCKDMVSALAHICKPKNFPVYPVIANIVDGMFTGAEHPANPFFNHLISAIPIAERLGLDSEVTVDGKHYLIIETTSKSTPLGKLPEVYRNRQLLICTPNGAIWTDVPEQAIEENQIQLKVHGSIDQKMTYQGTIQLTAIGDPLGLRAQLLYNRSNRLHYLLSKIIELPPDGNLEIINSDISLNDQIQIEAKVDWPNFLHRDENGYRLPTGLLYDERHNITQSNRPRINPFKLQSKPDWHVHINVRTAIPLDANREVVGQDQGPLTYQFRSQYDKKQNLLSIQYLFTSKSVIFKKAETAKAQRFWNNFTSDYNRAWRTEMLLHKAAEGESLTTAQN